MQGSLSDETLNRIATFQERLKAVRAEKTAETYARGATLMERFIVETNTPLARATPDFLDNFVQWLVKRGIMTSGIKLVIIGARRYLHWRRKTGEQIPEFELPDVPTKGGSKKQIIVFSTSQLAVYLGAVCQYRDPLRTMMLLLPMSGMRANEISQLEMSCIVTRPDIPLALHVMGKGSKPRIVPIGRQGRKILQTYLSTWRANCRPEVSWIFPGQGDEPIRNRSLRKALERIAKKMQVPRLHPHVLRRSYVTHLAARGVPTLMIAQLIGHGRPLEEDAPEVTMRYVHHDLVTMAKVIEKISFPAPVFPEKAA